MAKPSVGVEGRYEQEKLVASPANQNVPGRLWARNVDAK
jgi:hypothetical protein